MSALATAMADHLGILFAFVSRPEVVCTLQDVAVETLIDDAKGSEVDRWERVASGEVRICSMWQVPIT